MNSQPTTFITPSVQVSFPNRPIEGEIGEVYLIHFDTAFGHARHYTGWARNTEARMKHHQNGTGANLMKVVGQAGITWRVARLWKGADRAFERALKNRGGASRHCPICMAAKKAQA